jgi:ABC-type antimicrobial peptide transport system permease subunit
MKVDKFHENRNNIYQVLENVEQDGGIITRQSTSGPMAEELVKDMPEVEKAITTSTSRMSEFTLSVENEDVKSKGIHAGIDFFNIFSFELIEGNQDKALNDKSSIVISETLATKLFGSTTNVIGKMIELQHQEQFQVSGVFRDITQNSTLNFEYVLSFELLIDQIPSLNGWGNTGPTTFILLREGTDIDQFNEKFADYVKEKTDGQISHRSPFIARFSDSYLYGKYENGVPAGGRIEYVSLFSIIAIFILLIACINFMNLSTAKASGRIKEVGIKKAIGAQRKTLVVQYLGESTLMAFLSLGVAILMVMLVLPQFNAITSKELVLPFDPIFAITLFVIVLLTGLIAGSYPALYLSGFNTIAILKGGKLNNKVGEMWARKGLVIFQFALSVIFIVSVMVVNQQIDFIQKQHLGYEKDNVVVFGREGKLWDKVGLETFLSEAKNIPGILAASNIGHLMTGHVTGTSGIEWTGKDPQDRTEFENVSVNYEIMEMLDIPMKEGRAFSKDFAADSTKIIFNQAAIDYMGITDPLGKTVKLWGEDREIIGVSKDFHFESFHEEVKPLFLRLSPNEANNVMVKIEAGREQETLESLQQLYSEFNPGFVLNFRFLDEDYQAQYVAEQRVSVLSRYFAGIAILISCLGLFGLAAFTAERRIKEIGIRKVLGSSEWNIIRLLSGDFAKMVLVAIVIALPLSYYLTANWLDNFAYKIDLQWWYFIGAGALTMMIALLTVSFQSVKAALMNPVESLRSE